MDSNIQASVGRDKREAEITVCHLIVADGRGGPPSSSFTPVSMHRLFLPRRELSPVHALEAEELP